MTIPGNKIYPRTGDEQTIYLKNVITNPNISVGDYTMYNDFVNDPTQFEKNDETIAALQALKWWDFPRKKLERSISAIRTGDIELLKQIG